MSSKYRFLAFDGGGVRGVHTCAVLDFLESSYPGFLDKFDALAGTSTGSIIACGIAFGMSPKEIMQIYYEAAPKIFEKKWYSIPGIHQFWGTPYDLKHAELELKKVFGEATLGDLKKRVLVTSWNLDAPPNVGLVSNRCGIKRSYRRSSGKFWNNLHKYRGEGAAKIYEVLLSSIAAPTYFKPYKNHYMDGGLIQNCPGLPLVFQAICRDGDFRAELSEIRLLSLGTSREPVFFDKEKKRNWGLQNWIRTLSEALTGANMDFAEYGLQSILDERFYRFAPFLGEKIELDAVGKMRSLVEQTSEYLEDPLHTKGLFEFIDTLILDE